MIELIGTGGYLTEFQSELFEQAVKEVRISPEHEISFCLKNGLILTEQEGGGQNGETMAHADGIHTGRRKN